MDTPPPPEPPALHQSIDLPTSFARDVVLATFAADSYCLGPHWIYDLDRIDELYPDGLSSLDDPKSEYHPGKHRGDLTHYGDQTLILLETIATENTWDEAAWMRNWLAFWQSDPTSYLDGATRDVLDAYADLGHPLPSHSHDLAGASRIAPILALHADSPIEEVLPAVRQQTASTHDNPTVIAAAAFFARATWSIRDGASFSEAFAQAADSYTTADSHLPALYQETLSYTSNSPRDAALHFGQSCDVAKAFPLTLWLALLYEDQPQTLLEQNALIGGDSSARAMLLALLIAAQGNYPELPPSWTSHQTHLPRIQAALQSLNY